MPRPVKRSVTISGHSTSISLEQDFWDALTTIARQRKSSVAELVREIDASRADTGLSSAARLYALNYFRQLDGSCSNTFC